MAGHDIVVIGTSAGGVEALSQLMQGFPVDFPASVFVVLHTAPTAPGMLPRILERHCRLPVVAAQDKVTFRPGCIYVAPPDRHLLLEHGRMRVLRGPKENRHRPAIDPLFRSAAWSLGPRVVGLVLTGMLADGTSGLWSIKTCGGVTVVQDPQDAQFPDMPASAIKHFDIDYCLPLSELPRLLNLLARKKVPGRPEHIPDTIKTEVEAAVLGHSFKDMPELGKPSSFACPACRGAMWEVREGERVRYRCHVGHAFMPDALLEEQGEAVEKALFSALSVMEEKVAILRQMAAETTRSHPLVSAGYASRADQQEEYADQIRRLLGSHDS
jgi:two-component system chemotaxis response regulator CheB